MSGIIIKLITYGKFVVVPACLRDGLKVPADPEKFYAEIEPNAFTIISCTLLSAFFFFFLLTPFLFFA